MTRMPVARSRRVTRLSAAVCLVGAIIAGGVAPAAAAGPNIVAHWDKIAEDTVVGSGAAQIESLIYLSYTHSPLRRAGRPRWPLPSPMGRPCLRPAGASAEAAVVEAAYWTLKTYFPAASRRSTRLARTRSF